MERRRFLTVTGLLASGGLGGCDGRPTTDGAATETPTTTQPPALGVENGSFESGLTGWSVGRDLPTDPNKATPAPVDTDVSVTDDRASDGQQSVTLSIDGRQDDGTLWVQQETDLSGTTTLAVDLYSEQESFNTITKVAAYAGPSPDDSLTESDFDTSQSVEDHAGWKTYEYGISYEGTGTVAVGISVVWETELTRYLDNVRLV